MIYTTTYHAHRKELGIKQDEYTMLHAVMLLQNLKKNGFWCVAPNEYFTTFMDAETIRGVQKISKRLADMGLLIKGKGTQKRVSDKFVIGFNKFSKVQIGTHEHSSPMNSVHPNHEQRSPLNTNSVHGKHEQRSPNIESIETNSKKIKKSASLDLPFSSKEFQDAWEIWGQHRKEKRQKLTATTIKLQFKQLTEMGEARAIKALIHSAKNGYTGIFEDKADKAKAPQEIDWKKFHSSPLY